MQKPERSSYNSTDFTGWQKLKSLEISPKFQRRPVWSRDARSYFIETLLLGYPVPPLYLRVRQSEDGSKSVREVVDGQQRLRALLDYLEGGYSLSKSVSDPYIGKYFDDLSEEDKNRIKYFSFITEVFYGVTDREVLTVFARLNTNSVRLNAQELRNGKYFGPFKQTIYAIALDHLTFWTANKIVSDKGVARMAEAELTSEIVIAMIDGMQDKKKSINSFYEKFDDKFPDKKKVSDQFAKVIDEINESIGQDLKDTEFRRPPLFYSLFLAVFDRLYGLKNYSNGVTKGASLSTKDREALKDAVLKLSGVVERFKADEATTRGYQRFLTACLSQTDNIGPRKVRVETIFKEAFS